MRASPLLAFLVMVTVQLSAVPTALSLEPGSIIYRCDGTTPFFTNKGSYGCEEYRPRGMVAVSPNAIMFFGHGDPVPAAAAPAAAAPVDAGQERLCRLYDEWLALNEQTFGGLYYQQTSQSLRWQTLAKIFSAIGIPARQCHR
jgi:hypothetical protein